MAGIKLKKKPSLLQQILLCSVMFASEISVTYELIYMVIVQKWLGLPTKYLSLAGVISAPLSTLLIPVVGKFGDGSDLGSQRSLASKRLKRKSAIVVLVGSLHVIGGVLITIASIMKLHSLAEYDTRSYSDIKNWTRTAVSYPIKDQNYFIKNMNDVTLPEAKSGKFHSFPSYIDIPVINPNNMSKAIEREDSPNQMYSRTIANNYSILIPGHKDSNSTASESVFLDVRREADATLVLAVMAIVGFILLDVGFDMGSSSYRAYILECVDAEYHEQILSVSVFVDGAGGVLLGVVSVVDYSPFFHVGASSLRWYRNIFICGLLIITTVISVPVTIITGIFLKRQLEEDSGYDDTESAYDKKTRVHNAVSPTSQQDDEANDRSSKTHSQDLFVCGMTLNVNQEHSGSADTNIKTNLNDATPRSQWLKNQRTGFLRVLKQVFTYRRYTVIFLVCLITFFSYTCAVAFELYLDNFLSDVVYGEDGEEQSIDEDDDEAVRRYDQGVATTSIGMLVFEAAFVPYFILHPRVVRLIGLTGEFLLFSALVPACLFTVAYAESVPACYVAAGLCGMYSNVMFISPYVWVTERELEKMPNEQTRLVNKEQLNGSFKGDDIHALYTDYESLKGHSLVALGTNTKPAEDESLMDGNDSTKNELANETSLSNSDAGRSSHGNDDTKSSCGLKISDGENTGFTISLVSAMYPLAYFFLSTLMGPLLDSTGNPAAPIYFGAAAGMVSSVVVMILMWMLRRRG